MTYSIDLSYADYFKNAAEGKHENDPIKSRLRTTGMAGTTFFAACLRTAGRVVNIIVEIAKTTFYAIACFITLGKQGNKERLFAHCKLLGLNTMALVTQPIQGAIHSLALVVGVVHPKAANRMMQGATAPIAWVTSQENSIWHQYKAPKSYIKISHNIKTRVSNLFKNCPLMVRRVSHTLVHELPNCVHAVLSFPLGRMTDFHSFDANPKRLTLEQKGLRPILLLPGNHSHQGTLLPLLHALKIAGNKRPVYTINLPVNCVDPLVIAPKIRAIMEQNSTQQKLILDTVGHSMGASMSQMLCYTQWNKREGELGEENEDLDTLLSIEIGRMITVGTPVFHLPSAIAHSKPFDVVGTQDKIIPAKTQLMPSRHRHINTGHCGLMSHPKSLAAIQEFLKS